MRVMLACFVQAMRENICKHQWRELDEAEANDLGDDKYLQNTARSFSKNRITAAASAAANG